MRKREFKLDGFKWLKEESAGGADELPDPEDLAAEALAELKGVLLGSATGTIPAAGCTI